MASRAKTGLNEFQQSGQGQPGQGMSRGVGWMGDLIELDDGWEGRSSTATAGASGGGTAAITKSSARLQPQDEALVRGRLPSSASPGPNRGPSRGIFGGDRLGLKDD
jgi:hypothetical protein